MQGDAAVVAVGDGVGVGVPGSTLPVAVGAPWSRSRSGPVTPLRYRTGRSPGHRSHRTGRFARTPCRSARGHARRGDGHAPLSDVPCPAPQRTRLWWRRCPAGIRVRDAEPGAAGARDGRVHRNGHPVALARRQDARARSSSDRVGKDAGDPVALRAVLLGAGKRGRPVWSNDDRQRPYDRSDDEGCAHRHSMHPSSCGCPASTGRRNPAYSLLTEMSEFDRTLHVGATGRSPGAHVIPASDGDRANRSAACV